jgi:hypothetical protein
LGVPLASASDRTTSFETAGLPSIEYVKDILPIREP